MHKVQGFSDRSLALDALRAAAVIMVVFFHVGTRYGAAEIDWLGQQFLRYGFLGVDVFFPLSGYLITSYLTGQGAGASVGSFFIRRIFRIIPLYMVAVTLFVIGSLLSGTQADILDRIWITYAMLTAWFTAFWGPDAVPYTITWSITVEEFAYLLFGLMALLSRRAFPLFLVLLLVAPFFLRVWLYSIGFAEVYYFPLARLDSIAAGGITAYLVRHYRFGWMWLPTATVVFLTLRYLGPVDVASASLFSVVTFASCSLIAFCVLFLHNWRGMIMQVMARIGLYSYFIYLMHFFVIYGLFAIYERLGLWLHFWPTCALALGLSFGSAHFSFLWFEAPLIRLGRRLGK
ncbi:MAG: acyltransferase [Paracoccaceae bacterium]